MVFSSHIFLFYFLPIVLFIYYCMVWGRLSLSWINLFITVASYVFYGWLNPWFVTLMLVSTIVDYFCGKAISRPGATKVIRNTALTTSIIVNLSLLGFFKYAGFFAQSVNRIVSLFGLGPEIIPVLHFFLPAGISFYTFQTMSYTIDVWRGDAPPVKDMRTFSCFVALFSQLIAGPIIRYNTIAEQLSKRKHSLEMFGSGVAIFILGLAKKVILANAVAQVADAAFRADSPNMLIAWWGVLAYSFQIYFDFCGYSDMAVGLGRMMGFEFIKNFDAPYHADSMTNFWKRWHISLSTWFRDYLYLPLGGNRRGMGRTYFNLVIVMFLCGLWHGNQLHFLMWGIFQGAFLIFERLFGKKTLYNGLHYWVRVIITNIIICFGWVLFRAPSMDQAILYWGTMLGIVRPVLSAGLLHAYVFSLPSIAIMIVCALFVWQPVQAYNWVKKLTPVKMIVLCVLLIWTIATMFNQAFNPFLYFQF